MSVFLIFILLDHRELPTVQYIEFLAEKYAKQSSTQAPQKKRKAGLLKGKIWMAEDFDAPLEDMKDYM